MKLEIAVVAALLCAWFVIMAVPVVAARKRRHNQAIRDERQRAREEAWAQAMRPREGETGLD